MNILYKSRKCLPQKLAYVVYLTRLTLCFAITIAPSTALAFDSATEDALGGHEYPWYDADSHSVKPLEIPGGQESVSKERNTVPIGKPKSKTQTTPTTAPTGAGAGGGTGGGAAGSMSGLILAGIVLVVLVALVMTFLYIESNKSEQTVKQGRSRQQSIEQLPFDLDSSESNFQTAAETAYQNGDLRKAIIYLYSHVLVTLDQNGMIRLRKGKTNRQYLNEARRQQGIADYFRQVMIPFESVFFGDHDMDADQFQQCWSGLKQFHAKVKENAEVIIG